MGDDIELALCECLFGQRQINAGSQSTFQTGSDRLQHMLVLLERLVRQLRIGARSVVAVVGIRDVTDDLLVCGIEQNIRGQCRVLRAFANGIALTEVKQQPGQRQHGRGAADLVVDIHRAQLQWQLDGNAQALLASDDAGGQRRQKQCIGQADGEGCLTCTVPCQPGAGVLALGDINQLRQGQRRVAGVDGAGLEGLQRWNSRDGKHLAFTSCVGSAGLGRQIPGAAVCLPGLCRCFRQAQIGGCGAARQCAQCQGSKACRSVAETGA